jgi:hypothetical protein
MPKTTLAGIFTRILKKLLNFVFFLPVFFVFAIFVFRETRFFRNLGSFAKLRKSRNSCLIFAKHENRFVASFAKFSRNEISSKTLETDDKKTVLWDFKKSCYKSCLGVHIIFRSSKDFESHYKTWNQAKSRWAKYSVDHLNKHKNLADS